MILHPGNCTAEYLDTNISRYYKYVEGLTAGMEPLLCARCATLDDHSLWHLLVAPLLQGRSAPSTIGSRRRAPQRYLKSVSYARLVRVRLCSQQSPRDDKYKTLIERDHHKAHASQKTSIAHRNLFEIASTTCSTIATSYSSRCIRGIKPRGPRTGQTALKKRQQCSSPPKFLGYRRPHPTTAWSKGSREPIPNIDKRQGRAATGNSK